MRRVANYYDKTAARFCAPLASTLSLQVSSSEWLNLVEWTTSAPHSNYAIMDGVLHFVSESGIEGFEPQLATIMEQMSSDTRHIFEELRRSATPLASWEIKSTSAGPEEVMRAVPKLGQFLWTFCNSNACSAAKTHAKGLEGGRKIVVGCDARNPPWNLNVRSLFENRENVIDHTIERFFKRFCCSVKSFY
jgi:hypothetical protein